jgi:hypothetical protein
MAVHKRAFHSAVAKASANAALKENFMGLRLASALITAVIAASSPAAASAGGGDTLRTSRAIKYCATVTLNSRVSRKVCLTEQEWLNNGVRLLTHIPLA